MAARLARHEARKYGSSFYNITGCEKVYVTTMARTELHGVACELHKPAGHDMFEA
jgi:hypothetical protein